MLLLTVGEPVAARSKKTVPEKLDAKALLATYTKWLNRQPLAQRTRDAYLAQVSGFVSWLVESEHGAQALSEAHVRDWAVRDYKRHVKTRGKWAPTSVNQALAAIDNFYRSRGVSRPQVAREELAQVAPRALEVVRAPYIPSQTSFEIQFARTATTTTTRTTRRVDELIDRRTLRPVTIAAALFRQSASTSTNRNGPSG
jgi:Phage integrase, N-terminal SAM-like domain